MGSTKRRRPHPAQIAVGKREPFRPPVPVPHAVPSAAAGEELTPMQVFKKALTYEGRWTKETFPQFLDVLYWLRQIIAIVVGCAWGRAGSRGATSILSFVGMNIIVPRAYWSQWARVDEEDFDVLALIKEGFQPSFGLFMVTWIVAFNFFHGQTLAAMAAAAAAAAAGKE